MERLAAWLVIPLAVALDFYFGDPEKRPHPVRWMGAAVEKLEPKYRQWFGDEVVAGSLFAATLIFTTWAASRIAVQAAIHLHPLAGLALEAIMVYFAVSIRSLKEAAMAVHAALVHADLAEARKRVAMIVGRQTSRLDSSGVVRASVESVAENLVDGVLSPLFYALIGGAPLALAYKMINTLDSMVGYNNPVYHAFGKASARIDDAANFIPARLSVLVIALSAQIEFKRGLSAIKTAGREGRQHTSLNAGWPEAAFAGALQIQLGGPNHYHGELVQKPVIGGRFNPGVPEDISKACRLMQHAAVVWAVVLCGVHLFFI